MQNAKAVADQAVTILAKNPNTPDYKIATKLVQELADKIASNTKETGNPNGVTPATTQQGANLPSVDVNGLNNPPEVSTPAAVKKNPNTTLPNLKPTATPKSQ